MRDGPTEAPLAASAFPGELLVWLSPAFPVGSFAYSQGLEAAVAGGWVTDHASLKSWLKAGMDHGAIRNDLIVLSLIMRASTEAELRELAELSAALQPSAERAREALDQGRNFAMAYEAGWNSAQPAGFDVAAALTFPVALGLAARAHDLALAPTLEASAIAWCGNQISAAIRLGIVGQFDGQRLTAELLAFIRPQVPALAEAGLEDLGSATYGADLAAMLHETQTTRLFRS